MRKLVAELGVSTTNDLRLFDVVVHESRGQRVGDRASIATAIRSCQLPLFAPLEGSPFRGPV